MEPDFRLCQRRPWLPQEQDAPQATDLRFPPAFLMLLHQSVGLGQRLEAIVRVAQVVTDFCQQGVKVWDAQYYPGSLPGSDPLMHQGHSRLTLALHGQRPAAQARSPDRPDWKSQLGREHHGSFCLLVRCRYVLAQLIDTSRQTAVPPRPGAGHRAAAPLPVGPAWSLKNHPTQTVTGARCG